MSTLLTRENTPEWPVVPPATPPTAHQHARPSTARRVDVPAADSQWETSPTSRGPMRVDAPAADAQGETSSAPVHPVEPMPPSQPRPQKRQPRGNRAQVAADALKVETPTFEDLCFFHGREEPKPEFYSRSSGGSHGQRGASAARHSGKANNSGAASSNRDPHHADFVAQEEDTRHLPPCRRGQQGADDRRTTFGAGIPRDDIEPDAPVLRLAMPERRYREGPEGRRGGRPTTQPPPRSANRSRAGGAHGDMMEEQVRQLAQVLDSIPSADFERVTVPFLVALFQRQDGSNPMTRAVERVRARREPRPAQPQNSSATSRTNGLWRAWNALRGGSSYEQDAAAAEQPGPMTMEELADAFEVELVREREKEERWRRAARASSARPEAGRR